jgi:uncharacterized membrane protein YdjX (TVP38/TMEM64 family)
VEDRRVKRLGTIWRLIVLVGLISVIAYLALHREFLQRSLLERELLPFSRSAPILFLLIYAAATVLFVPGSILTIAGGALFGPVWGTLWNLSGATLGATLAFLMARYVASDWVSRTTGERLTRLMRGVEEEGWRFVAFVRLVPFFPFNLVNYAFGLTQIRITEYVAASFFCMAPGALAYTWLGYAGQQAASGQSRAIREGLLALALMAAVAFLPRLIRRLKGPRFIDPDELKRRLDSRAQLAPIDVRMPDEFWGPLGPIVSAENIPVVQLPGEIGKIKESRQKLLVTI